MRGVSVWFTSDLHFGHRLVAEKRGFPSIEEHDAAIAKAWPARADDQVWILGDLAVSSPRGALGILACLPGRKHLISGNHDGCHPMHRDAHKRVAQYLEVFESVQPFARRRVSGQEVLLSHFPYEADRGPARYTQYRLRDEGRWLLHGHTHGTERLHGHELHVGWDAWSTLVPLSTVEQLISSAS